MILPANKGGLTNEKKRDYNCSHCRVGSGLLLCDFISYADQGPKPTTQVEVINTPNVEVINNPLEVEVVNETYPRVPFFASKNGSFTGNGEVEITLPGDTVVDKYVVIETVSFVANVPEGLKPVIRFSAWLDGNSFGFDLPSMSTGKEGLYADTIQGLHQIRAYADPESSVRCKVKTLSSNDSIFLAFRISGYIVPIGSPSLSP